MVESLSSLSSKEGVDNVLIFISDSLRYDHLPSDIKELGVTGRAISACSMTASSLPSITTGQYPERHKIWAFDDRLPSVPPLLDQAENMGFNETTWTHLDPSDKPPLRIHRLNSQTELSELEEPFVYVHHDQGGHSPYGRDPTDISSGEYFDEMAENPERIPHQYREGVDLSEDRFFELLEQLRERGILEDTLVIFTSDHGELLGEEEYGGVYGHGPPMVPDVLNVPVTFLGAGLPEGLEFEGLLSGVDMAPTAMGALGWSIPDAVDGINVWNRTISESRTVKSQIWQDGRTISVGPASIHLSEYKSTSLWDVKGGRVRHMNGVVNRAVKCHLSHLIRAAHAPLCRTRLNRDLYQALLGTYLPRNVTYDEPGFDEVAFEESSSDEFRKTGGRSSSDSDIDKEHLKQLGYLE